MHGLYNSSPYNIGFDFGTYTIKVTASTDNGFTYSCPFQVNIPNPCATVTAITLKSSYTAPDFDYFKGNPAQTENYDWNTMVDVTPSGLPNCYPLA